MRRIILLIVFGLIAASCGSGESATDGPSGEVQQSTTTTADSPTSTSGAPSADQPADSSSSTTAPAPDQPLPESEYPAVVVADLAGGDFNLKELVLEEEPVLLWFWAPH